MTTSKNMKLRAAKRARRSKRKAAQRKQKNREHEAHNMKAKQAKRDQDFGRKSLNTVLRDLPEGTSVEPMKNGNLKISVQANRSEAEAVRSDLIDTIESKGLTEVPQEETEDASMCKSEV